MKRTNHEKALRRILEAIGYNVRPWLSRCSHDPANVIYEQMVIRDGSNSWISDFAMPHAKIDIEVDGVYWHHPVVKSMWQIENRLREERRTARLVALGWSIIRISGSVIENKSKQLENDLRIAILNFLTV